MEKYKIQFEFGQPQNVGYFTKTVEVEMPIGSEKQDIIVAALKNVGSYPRTYKVVDITKV